MHTLDYRDSRGRRAERWMTWANSWLALCIYASGFLWIAGCYTCDQCLERLGKRLWEILPAGVIGEVAACFWFVAAAVGFLMLTADPPRVRNGIIGLLGIITTTSWIGLRQLLSAY
jgi:hypothetical protein